MNPTAKGEPPTRYELDWMRSLFEHGDEIVEVLTRFDATGNPRLDPSLRLRMLDLLKAYDAYIEAQMVQP